MNEKPKKQKCTITLRELLSCMIEYEEIRIYLSTSEGKTREIVRDIRVEEVRKMLRDRPEIDYFVSVFGRGYGNIMIMVRKEEEL